MTTSVMDKKTRRRSFLSSGFGIFLAGLFAGLIAFPIMMSIVPKAPASMTVPAELLENPRYTSSYGTVANVEYVWNGSIVTAVAPVPGLSTEGSGTSISVYENTGQPVTEQSAYWLTVWLSAWVIACGTSLLVVILTR